MAYLPVMHVYVFEGGTGAVSKRGHSAKNIREVMTDQPLLFGGYSCSFPFSRPRAALLPSLKTMILVDRPRVKFRASHLRCASLVGYENTGRSRVSMSEKYEQRAYGDIGNKASFRA